MKRDIPHRVDIFDNVLGYDYNKHLWMYDCKYYLIDGFWVYMYTGEKMFELNDFIKNEINNLQSIVDKKEIEYQKKDQYEICRKRTCRCKQCEIKCLEHCVGCNEKIMDCDRFHRTV